ncbi:putative glutathione S-transferase 6 [Aphelenchoides bicaudatus]|nr:putative glutathione S-transferase 6 [Aphelenchoides bicaudatus]
MALIKSGNAYCKELLFNFGSLPTDLKMTYKLTYFDERNRAEPLRLIFEYAGQKFEDIRLNDQEFLKQRNSFPNGQLPVLEFDNGKVLGQSGSIIRFLARKFNLVGSNETEAARADEVFETYKDRLNEQIPYIMFKVGDPNFKDGEKYYKDGYLPASKRALKYYDEVIGDKQFVLNSGPKLCRLCSR